MKIFIPIKKHSERVPNKNFRAFGRCPLYRHMIQKLKGLGRIFIDTDAPHYWFMHIAYANIYTRPASLRGGGVPVNLLIKNFLENYVDDDYETIVQTHVTSPFLKIETLRDAISKFEFMQPNYRMPLMSVTRIQDRCWAEGRPKRPINHDPFELVPTQELEPVYVENSAFYIFTKRTFMEYEHRAGSNPTFYPLGWPENIDINTEEDWELCVRLREMGYE